MKKANNNLQELVNMANDLGLSLMLDEKLALYAYDKEGGVKSIHRFDRDPDGIAQLKTRISKVAAKLRKKWKPEFKQFASIISDLKMDIDFQETIVELTDGKGNSSFYYYNEDGPHAMADDLADILLCQQVSKAKDETEQTKHAEQNPANPPKNICPNTGKPSGGCHGCHNTSCKDNPQLINLLWDELDEDRRNKLFAQLPQEMQDKLQTALKTETQA